MAWHTENRQYYYRHANDIRLKLEKNTQWLWQVIVALKST